MRILHTSDWHLGKSLEGFSRLDEQKAFLKDFCEIVKKNDIDIVIIAGDIYDTSNPPAQAEALFYETIVDISEGGKRCVIVIAGNHDSSERLETIVPLVEPQGIVVLGYLNSTAKKGRYKGFDIVDSKEGFTKISKNGEVINIIALPYPSEKRLNDIIEKTYTDTNMQISYSKKIANIFEDLEKNYREDEINIAVSHIFVVGSSTSESERRIELGGSLLVEKSSLPSKSDYTALGHIHKPQTASKSKNAYYSGSPIQYSKSEANTAKSVNIVDLEAGKEAKIKKEYIKTYKPISVYRLKSIEEAKKLSEELKGKDIFLYIEIEVDDIIPNDDIKYIKSNLGSVIEIRPIIKSEDYSEEDLEVGDLGMENVEGYFVDFYRESTGGLDPSEDVVDLFCELIGEVIE